LSHSTSAASRRRPTILKRGAGPNAAPVITNVFAGPRHTDPYRYALLRGSADGKRYLVLGNQGLFEKNSAGSLNSNVSDEALTEQTEAIDALQSQTELPLGFHASRLITESRDQEDSSIDVDESMKADRAPAL
uniref:AMP_N domain-containing protein n=1 Tax=Echinostoma caproni TaxID=27848 RepID=A0A183APM2_9TREM